MESGGASLYFTGGSKRFQGRWKKCIGKLGRFVQICTTDVNVTLSESRRTELSPFPVPPRSGSRPEMSQAVELAHVEAHAGQAQSEETKAASPRKMASPSKRKIAFTTLLTHVLQTAPIAVVQFADFVTDVFVVIQLWEREDRTSAVIGFGFMALSILLVILGERSRIPCATEDLPGAARATRCAGTDTAEDSSASACAMWCAVSELTH